VNARYFRFTSLRAIWGSGWTSAAEISVLLARENSEQVSPERARANFARPSNSDRMTCASFLMRPPFDSPARGTKGRVESFEYDSTVTARDASERLSSARLFLRPKVSRALLVARHRRNEWEWTVTSMPTRSLTSHR